MLGYALNDQMSYEKDLIGIFVLIPILKNCFLRIVINAATRFINSTRFTRDFCAARRE